MHECSTCGPPKAVEEGRRPDFVVLGVELPRLVAGELEVGVTQPSALFGAPPLRLLNNGEPTTVVRAAIKGITLIDLPKKGITAKDSRRSQHAKKLSRLFTCPSCDATKRTDRLTSFQQRKKGTAPEEKIAFYVQ